MKETYRCAVCGGTESEAIITGIRDWEYGVPGEFSHRRCHACGTVQLHPFPELSDLITAYQVDYHGYVESESKGLIYSLLYRLSDLALRRSLRGVIGRGSRVLDVGCGSGELLQRLRRIGIAQVDGIDFSERAVALARARGIRAFQGTFLDFPAEPGSYDAIFMNNYLEHTLDPVAEVRRAHRLLRPGGYLIGELPNYRSLDRFLFGRYWGGNHAPRHTFQFDEETLTRLLLGAGFCDVRTDNQVNTTHFALSLQNLLERGSPSRLRHGRAGYYGLLLLALVPLNLLCALLHLSGVMKFRAVAKPAARGERRPGVAALPGEGMAAHP